MRDDLRSRLTLLLVLCLCASFAFCGTKGGNYIGRWECASGGGDFFEIKANNGAFLVTDEDGATYPAALDDKGILIASGVPLLGSLPLPIDSATGELICSACHCHRLTKKPKAAEGASAPQSSAPSANNSVPQLGGTSDDTRQKETVAAMQKVGTAMFSWLTDQVGAGAAGQMVNVEDIPAVSSFAELQKLLVPAYIQNLPERDGWAHPFEYRLNTADPKGKTVMSIRSPGRDGQFSGSRYEVGAFPRTDYDHDIVWADGRFIQWPQ